MSPHFSRSIRWNVQLWHGAILLLAIAAFCGLAIRFSWSNHLRQVDQDIRTAGRETLFQILHDGEARTTRDVRPPRFEPARLREFLSQLQRGEVALPAAVAALFADTEPGHRFFIVLDQEGKILLRSPNAPADYPVIVPAPGSPPSEELKTVGRYREALAPLPEGLAVVYARDLKPDREGARRFALTLTGAGLGVWIVGLLGGWWLGGRAIKPIRTISGTATRIADGDLTERIDTTGMAAELQQLSTVLNATFDRLHAAFERQKQFTADASHELRTPLTILLSESQRMLKRERTPAEYQDAFRTCLATTERMKRLIEDLLLLARQDGSATPLAEPTDLAQIARETLRNLEPLAAARGLVCEAHLWPAVFKGDAAAIGIVLTNLVQNAISHHDRPTGRIVVITGREGDHVICTVQDDGPGIAAEHVPHLFERFYRADPARTATDHSGLGLAIAHAIVMHHGGAISFAPAPGRGALFRLSLPVALHEATGRART